MRTTLWLLMMIAADAADVRISAETMEWIAPVFLVALVLAILQDGRELLRK